MLIDTHCHIHEASYPLELPGVLARAADARVDQMICIGTDLTTSAAAMTLAETHDHITATIGVHPHDTKDNDVSRLEQLLTDTLQVVGIGEIGLDYFYSHSPRDIQIVALEAQLDIAQRHNLPVVFHVREAFDDFWPIFDNFTGLRGVLHSFTDTQANVDQAMKRGLYIGVNGISTFTKDATQKEMYCQIPLEKLLLETDAPFLTPAPLRGKVNEPAFVRIVAEHHASVREISFDDVATATTANARALFAL